VCVCVWPEVGGVDVSMEGQHVGFGHVGHELSEWDEFFKIGCEREAPVKVGCLSPTLPERSQARMKRRSLFVSDATIEGEGSPKAQGHASTPLRSPTGHAQCTRDDVISSQKYSL
jgi:hypothetical protein